MSITIGLVGCGRWGANVLRDLLATDVTVVVADPIEDRRVWALGKGCHRAVDHVEHVPESAGYVVATPAGAHREVCEALLGRGVPVYVEKPPCSSLDDVVALSHCEDGRLFVMHKWRYHSGVESLAELIERGALGEPVALISDRTGQQALPADVDVVWHLAVHDLSIAHEILGETPAALQASGVLDGQGRLIACEAILRSSKGVKHHLRVATGNQPYFRRFVVEGSTRTAELTAEDHDRIAIRGRDGSKETISLSQRLPLERELQAFVAFCAGGPPPKSSFADAMSICQELAKIATLARGTG